jgi:hypothetical protein
MLEEPINGKVMVDFKRPKEMSPEENKSLPTKNNWQSNIKYRLHSINRDAMNSPIHLFHLIILTSYKLKVLGNDDFGKVSTHCYVGARVVSHIPENNFVFFLLDLPDCAYLSMFTP